MMDPVVSVVVVMVIRCIPYHVCVGVTCEENGCPRRQGGQGDILSGSIGLFLYWTRVSEER